MILNRAYGLLLHPTSIPGPWGIGVLGWEARSLLDWLETAGASWLQVLPLGATGYGDSPYQTFSAFAGNPYLIDPDDLFDRGWLPREAAPAFSPDGVDYAGLYRWKWPFLRRAFAGFQQHAHPDEIGRLHAFCGEESYWLPDFALFMACKSRFAGRPWNEWPAALRRREPAALATAHRELAEEVAFQQWAQWVFSEQWSRFREEAHHRGIRIIGDMPIFVAYDSADVWANPGYFLLGEGGSPTVVAGVPPDYFSATGQRWGNPLYRWAALEADGFRWWIERLRTVLATCDQVRIDHFRGFQAYWEIPAEEPTAQRGRWVTAPGQRLFETLRERFGRVPIIAEDLGVITEEVGELRDRFDFPGMKVLQFAFADDERNAFLPHNYPTDGNCLVYTGTHDNDTTLGWYRTASAREIDHLDTYLTRAGLPTTDRQSAPWSLIALALQSPACLAILPLQDVLALGPEARMNEPARAEGNWSWRYASGSLTPQLARRLHRLAHEADRLPQPPPSRSALAAG